MVDVFQSNVTRLGMGLGLLVALIALLYLQNRGVSRLVAHVWGWRGMLLTAWIGVPIHELSHLIFAKLFGHRIVDWSLFSPDPVSGTLGYVRHRYQKRNLYQLLGTAFIGLAPLIVGGALLLALLWSLLSREVWSIFRAEIGRTRETDALVWLTEWGALYVRVAVDLWRHRDWQMVPKLYLGISIAQHLAPSPADLKASLPGVCLILMALLLTAFVASLFRWHIPLSEFAALPLCFLYPVLCVFQSVWVGVAWMGHVGGARRVR